MDNREKRDNALDMVKYCINKSLHIRKTMLALRSVLEDKRVSFEDKADLWTHYEKLAIEFDSANSSAKTFSRDADKYEKLMKEELITEVEEEEKEMPF
jgi:hypothetical protein